jgi:hypothetical protein
VRLQPGPREVRYTGYRPMYRLVRAAQLRLRPRQQTLTLLTDTRPVDISEAAVLADLLLDPETTTDSNCIALR